MRRFFPIFLCLLIILSCVFMGAPSASASTISETFFITEPDIWFAYGNADKARMVIFEIGLDFPFTIEVKNELRKLTFTISASANDLGNQDLRRVISAYRHYDNAEYFVYMQCDWDVSTANSVVFSLTTVFDLSHFNFGCHNDFGAFDFPFSSWDIVVPNFVGSVDYTDLLQDIKDSVDSGNQSMIDWFTVLNQNMILWFQNINSTIASGFANVGSWFSKQYDMVGSWFLQLSNNVQQWFLDLGTNISVNFSNLISSLSSWWTGLFADLSSIQAKLDQLIEGSGAAGDKLQNAAGDMSQSGSDLKDAVTDIENFEQDQFGTLDQNMGVITEGGSIANLTEPLSHILTMSNHIVEAIPSNYRSYWTVPFFFGIFFLICQHSSGVTSTAQYVEYRSKPKRSIGFGRDD